MQEHNSTSEAQIEDWDYHQNGRGDGLLFGRLLRDNGHKEDLAQYQVSFISPDSNLAQLDNIGLVRLGVKANRSKSELFRMRNQCPVK